MKGNDRKKPARALRTKKQMENILDRKKTATKFSKMQLYYVQVTGTLENKNS